jgi:Domain of unknown function (DUF4432)
MSGCAIDAVQWKNRQGCRLSNGLVELTVLTGGGHIADFRLNGSPMNAIWEAPWPTIEPQNFSAHRDCPLYGDDPVGKFLCGYTGHALVLGFFGMPSPQEAEQGLALHGEAASAEWKVVSSVTDNHSANITMEVAVPVYRLHFRREISLLSDSYAACITERVTNLSSEEVEFQWVEHAAFGEPLLTNGDATIFVSGMRGVTWPNGYEGHEILASDVEYRWPYAQSIYGEPVDLSQPFVKDGTGFVAALLAAADRGNAFVAVHNRKHQLVAGYRFDGTRFPWIVMWEENCAREHAPWNKETKVRGVEFGTSPMPLGLEQARAAKTLFEQPVLASLPAGSCLQTQYDLFLSPAPRHWTQIKDVRQLGQSLVVQGDGGEEIKIERSNRFVRVP